MLLLASAGQAFGQIGLLTPPANAQKSQKQKSELGPKQMSMIRSDFRSQFDELEAHGRVGPDFDQETIVELTARSLRRGDSSSRQAAIMQSEMRCRFFSFGRISPTHDESAKY